jgi:antitoxin component of MazEF toxin-antitoxin module
MTNNKSFTITKRIAKHGKQAVIIIPALLQQHLEPGKLVEIRIEIINN